MKKLMMVCLILFSVSLYAIEPIVQPADGFENVKFGITIEALTALNKCGLQFVDTRESLTLYRCMNFNYIGVSTMAYFGFIENKLQRFQVIIGATGDSFYTWFNAYIKLYGLPTAMPDADMINEFDRGASNHLDVSFKHNITLAVDRNFELDKDGQIVVMVTYWHPKFNEFLLAARKRQQ